MIKVKICGITHPDDAKLAAHACADFIGIIFCKQSKRRVSLSQAKEIHSAILSTKTEIVGVFCNESIKKIVTLSEKLNISIIQLHGNYSSTQLSALSHFKHIFYAMPLKKKPEENSVTHFNKNIIPLFDNVKPGSGVTFDWSTFSKPEQPWILAGGLHSRNVGFAIHRLNPHMVDVSSGVEQNLTIRKDPVKIHAFIKAAKKRRVYD